MFTIQEVSPLNLYLYLKGRLPKAELLSIRNLINKDEFYLEMLDELEMMEEKLGEEKTISFLTDGNSVLDSLGLDNAPSLLPESAVHCEDYESMYVFS